MPLITEHGFIFDRAERERSIRPLVHEPTEEWIRSFGETYEEIGDTNEKLPTSEGKFVAVRNLLLLAPYPVIILHRNILEARNIPVDLGPRIADEVAAARREGLMLLPGPTPTPVTDGGSFSIKADEGRVVSVRLHGESFDYGRGDDTTRAKTADLLRRSIGDIEVIAH